MEPVVYVGGRSACINQVLDDLIEIGYLQLADRRDEQPSIFIILAALYDAGAREK